MNNICTNKYLVKEDIKPRDLIKYTFHGAEFINEVGDDLTYDYYDGECYYVDEILDKITHVYRKIDNNYICIWRYNERIQHH